MQSTYLLSIIMPCLNEAETLAVCIKKAQGYLEQSKISGEIIIADNGSTDGSQDIAKSLGARVVPVAEKGYGAAIRGGIEAAYGQFCIIGDADDSYDFSDLDPYVKALQNNADLVIGNRFLGGIKPGAMPWKNRYIGNPFLSGLARLLFQTHIHDFHCGLRGITKKAFKKLNLTTPGMEFASEMIVIAALKKMDIQEVPTTLSPDGRSRPPHLRPWRDGFRHVLCLFKLRFFSSFYKKQ